MCVPNRNPNCWTYLDKIWHTRVPRGQEDSWGFQPTCQDLRWAKGGPVGFWSLSLAFWQKVLNTKVAEHPQISRGGSSCWIRIRIRKDLGLV